MAEARANRCGDSSRALLAQALQELARGDSLQASEKHTNFYENWQPQEYVQGSVEVIEHFISRLELL